MEDEKPDQQPQMKQPISAKRQVISVAIVIFLIVVTVWIVGKKFKATDFSQVLDRIEEINPGFIMLALVFMLLFIMCEGLCYVVIGKHMGLKISIWRSAAYAAADLYFSGITPSAAGGQPVAVYYMNRDGIRVTDGTLILIFNLFMYASSLIVLEIVAVVAKFDFLQSTPKLFKILFVVGTFWQVLMVVGCLICMFSGKTIKWFEGVMIRCCDKWKIIKNKEEKKKQAVEGIRHYTECMDMVKKNPRMSLETFGANMLQRLCFFAVGYCVYRSFGLDSASFFSILMLQVIVTLAMYSLPIPGGIGAAEMSFMVVFTGIYTQGSLMPGMIITRMINFYLLIVVCGLITLCYHVYISGRERGRIGG